MACLSFGEQLNLSTICSPINFASQGIICVSYDEPSHDTIQFVLLICFQCDEITSSTAFCDTKAALVGLSALLSRKGDILAPIIVHPWASAQGLLCFGFTLPPILSFTSFDSCPLHIDQNEFLRIISSFKGCSANFIASFIYNGLLSFITLLFTTSLPTMKYGAPQLVVPGILSAACS